MSVPSPKFHTVLFLAFFAAASFLAAPTLAVAQSEQVIHHFFTSAGNGSLPAGGVVADRNGALYGATEEGGTICDVHHRGCGVAYKLSPPVGTGSWQYSILYSFPGGDSGGVPLGNVAIDGGAGAIYGALNEDCAYGKGGVFALQPGNPWTETVIYSFAGPEGAYPDAGVVLHDGDLYGVTSGGSGSTFFGTIYRLLPPAAPGSAWTEETIYSFTSESGTSYSLPVFDASGNLYGATAGGSALGGVYELSPPAVDGEPWSFSFIYKFTSATGGSGGPLVFDGSGALYGIAGSTDGKGTVFKLTPPARGKGEWTESSLYSFTGGTGGGSPGAGVVFDNAGNLYGVTEEGGDLSCNAPLGCGILFELTPPSGGGNWTETVLHSFQGGNDGEYPGYAPLLLNGKIYGTTPSGGGGSGAGGTVYEVTP